ncbi:MAG: hypothetical protein KBF80_05330 [Flavobacteriales bacterium]|nr:hypothetical protein [Flavobacteriales bacterium]
MTRLQRLLRCCTALFLVLATAFSGWGQDGDKALRAEADALFEKGAYAKAYPLFSQLVSLAPQDHELNFKLGACTIFGGDDKTKAAGYLKFALAGPATSGLAWYFLGRAYQLDYRFNEALDAYKHFRGTGDKKLLARFPVDALEQQCRNGLHLLSNLKDIQVMNKVEVDASDFFRFYDLGDIGGKIVVTPDELLSGMDRRSGERFLVYLPDRGGPIFFSSYGKDGKTGRDIYRTELLPTGGYAAPVLLAGYINTPEDEDFAVMATDERTFFFCSKGHNSMGGYDVFKSTYDKGMDVFSAPENMDFAVNTPADERLYILGPDGKEACFASDRDSQQDMLKVYRVSTTQTPINITLLKGTFASNLDPGDKRARIIVEDELTGERITEVATDAQGNYTLVLPRGGKYRLLVEAGPEKRTYLAALDVPPSKQAQAFQQEMDLVYKAGIAVEVKNHFDQPLDGNLLALALEEVRRRARLDVSATRTTAALAAPAPETGDPLQAAGFDGTVTMAQTLEMAGRGTKAEQDRAEEQERVAKAAMELAMANLEVGEQQAAMAANLVQQGEALTPSPEREQLMRRAAQAKLNAEDAWQRAMAAYRSSGDMATAATASRKRETDARALQLALERANSAMDPTATTTLLKQLKAGLDARTGPDARPDDLELMRRSATEAEQDAQAKLRRANSQRGEQSQLAERVARLSYEAGQAKGRKQQDLKKELAVLKEQDLALREEVAQAFQEAQETEQAAALVRGQVQLLRYLDAAKEQGRTGRGLAVPDNMEQRLAAVHARNSSLEIAQEFLPLVAASPAERDLRIFNWGVSPSMVAGGANPTLAAARTSGGVISRAAPQETDPKSPASVARPQDPQPTPTGVEDARHPSTNRGYDQANTRTGSTDSSMVDRPAEPAQEGTAGQLDEGGAGPVVNEQADGLAGGRTDPAVPPDPTALRTDPAVPDVVEAIPLAEPAAAAADSAGRGVQQSAGKATGEARSLPSTTHAEPPLKGTGPGGQGPPGETGMAAVDGASTTRADELFLLSNGLAELEQLRHVEKDRDKRDSLDQVIEAQKERIEHLGTARNAEPAQASQLATHNYVLLDFDMSMMDEELLNEIIPGFALHRDSIVNGTGTHQEKAALLHALEMRLIDSIDVQMRGTVDHLDKHPEQAGTLLPRLERWRRTKAAHLEAAEKALAAVKQEYVAVETQAFEDALLAASGAEAPVPSSAEEPPSPTPHNDAYVQLETDMRRIFLSPLAPRSAKTEGAVARLEQDMVMAEDLQMEIDSMEQALSDLEEGEAYDQLVERTDRMIDDLLIHSVDVGQRSVFITRSEFESAKDSSKVLTKRIMQSGTPPDAPLEQMARAFEADALKAMDHAKTVRRKADNTNDILVRDSLYRSAYAEELKALRNMDRSLTVRNFLLDGKPAAAQQLTYAEVEQRLFGGSTPGSQEVLAIEPSAPIADQSGGQVHAPADSARGTARSGGASTFPVSIRRGPEQVLPWGVNTPTDSTTLAGYLQRFYYLDPQERLLVVGGAEESRYFLMKGHAMEQRAGAGGTRMEADGARELAAILEAEARELRGKPAALEQVGKLGQRADALVLRSDSLRKDAARQEASADLIDAQAAAWMQSLDADRSAAIMDLEQTNRRTEPVLAQSRPSGANAMAAEPVGSHASGVPAAKPTPPNAFEPVLEPMPVAADTSHAPPLVTEITGGRPSGGIGRPERMAPLERPANNAPAPVAPALVQDAFTLDAQAPTRKLPIPMDAAMPVGVVYKVQVGAFRNPLPAEAFSDMSPLTGERAANGVIRYSAGLFTSAASAAEAGVKLRQRGYRDAFVVAYLDGARVSLREALEAERPALAQGTASAPPSGQGVSRAAEEPVKQTAQSPTAPADLSAQGTAEAAESAVLASYPATAEAVLEAFKPATDASAYYNDPAAAPAEQVETVKGLFFTVQVGVYSKPTALDRLFNITPLNSELTANAKIRYTTGQFRSEDQAAIRKAGTVALGVADAFVTAYLNGKRIPLRDARVLLAKFGKSILAQPVEQVR